MHVWNGPGFPIFANFTSSDL
uniref:Uncharacterized protein n=1 Tax=Anguilla anguilla TaxID=7936 RepID=A0A0E9QF76_ANGAN